MKKQLENFLLTLLVGTSVLLVLTFWLNTKFGFNLFSSEHWHELSILQASGEKIDNNFYISIGIALLVFIILLNVIYRPNHKKDAKTINTLPVPITQNQPIENSKPDISKQSEPESHIDTKNEEKTTEQTQHQKQTAPETTIALTRPPRLNLPKNAAEIAAIQHNQIHEQTPASQTDKYDKELEKIFSENSFLVKKQPTISGFKPNLFAIGVNEIVWIGGVDCELDKINNAIKRLESTFTETLEDITITVNAFLIDTKGKYNSDERIKIFHNIEELGHYISENPSKKITDDDREDFDAYSEYIDTVLSLLYKT